MQETLQKQIEGCVEELTSLIDKLEKEVDTISVKEFRLIKSNKGDLFSLANRLNNILSCSISLSVNTETVERM